MRFIYLLFICFFSFGAFAQYDFDQNVDWLNVKMVERQFDKEKNEIEREVSLWNNELNDWEAERKNNHSFVNKNLISTTNFKKIGKEYQSGRISSYDYQSINSKELRISKNYSDPSKKVKEVRTRKTIQYLTENREQEVEVLTERWIGKEAKWKMTNRLTKTFDSKGLPTKELTERWDRKENNWRQFSLFEKTYPTDNEAITIKKKWDREAKDWKFESKTIKDFHPRNSVLESASVFHWDHEMGEWYLFQLSELNLIDENIEYSLLSTLDKSRKKLRAQLKKYYVYDKSGEIDEIVFQRWNSNFNRWMTDERILYKRNKSKGLVKEIHQKAILKTDDTVRDQVYKIPNPYVIGTPIVFENLKNESDASLMIYDLNGSLKFETPIANGTVEINNFLTSSNYYFIVVSQGKISYKQQIHVVGD